MTAEPVRVSLVRRQRRIDPDAPITPDAPIWEDYWELRILYTAICVQLDAQPFAAALALAWELIGASSIGEPPIAPLTPARAADLADQLERCGHGVYFSIPALAARRTA